MPGSDASGGESTAATPDLAPGSGVDGPSDVGRLSAERDALRTELAQLRAQVEHWRAAALDGWEQAAQEGGHHVGGDEAAAMRQTLSWRITRPLRAVRRLLDARAAR